MQKLALLLVIAWILVVGVQHTIAEIVMTDLSVYYRADNVDSAGTPGNAGTTTLVNLVNPGTHDGTLTANNNPTFGVGSVLGVTQNAGQIGTPYEYGVVMDGSHIRADSFKIAGGVNKATSATWEFWLYVDDCPDFIGTLYMEHNTASSVSTRHDVQLNNLGDVVYDEYPSTPSTYGPAAGTYTQDQFMQLVVVKDGDAVRVYNNGSLVGASTNSETYTGGDTDQTFFGDRGQGTNETIRPWDGQFNIIRVYDNALTDAQVLQNYNDTFSPSPAITGDPVPQVVAAASTAEFTVTANNTDTYYWYKVGSPDVLVATHSNTSGTDTLTLTDVQAADEGLYYCIVENAHGTDTSNTGELVLKQLIGHWKFDDPNESTTAADYSGFGNDGIIHGNPSDVPGDSDANTSLNFDGVDDYVEIPTDALDPLVNQVSIVLWQYGMTSQPRTDFIYFSYAMYNDGSRAFSSHLPYETGRIYWDAGSNDRISKATTSAEYGGAWHQWSFIKNAMTGVMSIYLDGKLWHSGTGLSDDIFDLDVSKFVVGAGLAIDEETPIVLRHYAGKVKEFRVYNYALDAEGVAQIYYDDTGVAVCDAKPVGDLTDDCLVDLNDLLIIASHWLNCMTDDDLTNDCLVDLNDLSIIANHWYDCTLLPSSQCP